MLSLYLESYAGKSIIQHLPFLYKKAYLQLAGKQNGQKFLATTCQKIVDKLCREYPWSDPIKYQMLQNIVQSASLQSLGADSRHLIFLSIQ